MVLIILVTNDIFYVVRKTVIVFTTNRMIVIFYWGRLWNIGTGVQLTVQVLIVIKIILYKIKS